MDDESGDSMELMEEVRVKGLGESELGNCYCQLLCRIYFTFTCV